MPQEEKSKQRKELIPTDDGSLTLKLASLDELYHNRSGAYLEALNNYALPAKDSFLLAPRQSCTVLDACFGLGYNSLAFLTVVLEEKEKGNLRELSRLKIEAVDNDASLIALFERVLAQTCFAPLRARLPQLGELLKGEVQEITTPVNTKQTLTPEFRLHTMDLRDYLRGHLKENSEMISEEFDLIFHDAFAPQKTCELWTIDFFALYLAHLSPSGSIITYSCAPAIRGALSELGLNLFATPALGAKPGGTLASRLKTTKAQSLSAEAERRLTTRGKIPYRDPSFALDAKTIKSAREEEQRLLDYARSQ